MRKCVRRSAGRGRCWTASRQWGIQPPPSGWGSHAQSWLLHGVRRERYLTADGSCSRGHPANCIAGTYDVLEEGETAQAATTPTKVDSVGQIFGTIGVILGLSSLVMPYFATVFLVPAALVCGVVALVRKQKSLGVVVMLLAVVGLIGIATVSNQINDVLEDPFSPSATFQSDDSPVVTLAEYEQLRGGMTYEEAVAVIGTPGEELSRSEVAGYTTVMYTWSNAGGSNMNAMFQDGALITKAQLGLH